MRLWIALSVLAGAAFAFLLRRTASSGNLDAGTVSESWLRQHRADRQDPFSS
jgi:hypothetical protein